MRGSAASVGAALAGALAAALVIGVVAGARGGLITAAILAPVGGLTVLAAARAHRRPRLRGQIGMTAALAAVPLVTIVALFVLVMFVSARDGLVAALAAAYAGLVAGLAGRLAIQPVLSDVDLLHAALNAVGAGERAPVVPAGGDELAELGADVRAMAARLQAGEDARRHLIAAVSHDLRTPLTSLRLLAEAVGDEVVDSETRQRYLAQLPVHVRALSALIDDLFELSRIEAGDIAWSMQRVALGELVAETVDVMRAQADVRSVSVRAEIPDELACASGNPEKLQRVLFNLIQNAIRHTPADGSVVVRAERAADGGVEVEVADTGEGIDAEERAQVFEPFFRGGNEVARTGDGAGLGLAVSRAIVEAHGGRIWLADAGAEPGTRIRFTLPVAA
jgi:signal transduction histidine kinase